MSTPPDPISTQDAADRLGCSRRHVQHLIATGALPAVRVGRVLAVRPGDVDALPPPDPGKGGYPRGKPRIARGFAPRKKSRKKSPRRSN